jgi:hypothetical protein
MHYQLEIVMPQVEDIEKSVGEIMAPFDENNEDSYKQFCDYWVIGGRWAGEKLIQGLDKNKLEQFYADLKENKITVSGIQCGKQEISPSSQIPLVDNLWRKYFPEYISRACPLFKHSNDQYINDCLYGDILRVKDLPPETTACKCIIASYDYDGKSLEAKEMFSEDLWNGVSFERTTWDTKITTAIEKYKEHIKNYKEEYRKKHEITDDWLVVTVDYHS